MSLGISNTAQDKLREQINKDVDDFLARGGVIAVIPAGAQADANKRHRFVEVNHDVLMKHVTASERQGKVYAVYDGADDPVWEEGDEEMEDEQDS